MDLEWRVAVLEATEDVRALFRRYTWALDHADFDGIVGCFEEDGAFVFQQETWRGHDAIHAYFEEDRTSHTEMLHYPVNIIVGVTHLDPEGIGSGRAVATATLWDLFNRRTAQGKEGACLAGYYEMTARRRAGVWAIQRLEVDARWVVPADEWRMSPEFRVRPEARP